MTLLVLSATREAAIPGRRWRRHHHHTGALPDSAPQLPAQLAWLWAAAVLEKGAMQEGGTLRQFLLSNFDWSGTWACMHGRLWPFRCMKRCVRPSLPSLSFLALGIGIKGMGEDVHLQLKK
eukprot:1144723-Pelagomonas_calceolata.AAC.1